MDTLQNFIDGTYTDAKTDRVAPVVDPTTGQPYTRAPISGVADVDAACWAAGNAFPAWRATSPAERSLALFRIADVLEARSSEFIEAECRNTGKPLRWMREEEWPQVLDHLRFMATLARSLGSGLPTGSYLPGYDSSVRREPVGVCGQVAPWNYPLLMAVWKLGPALAAGNTVVLKPSDTTPVTTAMLGEVVGEHLPPGVLNIVIGDRDTGRALVAHPRPDLISVTGSVRAGMEVAAAAAPDLKRVHLELGGKAPAVVLPDAPVEETVEGIAGAGYLNAGQDCAASTRVLVHQDLHDELVDALVRKATTVSYGRPEEDVDYGPLNSANQLDRVQGFLDRAGAHAEVRTGGTADRRDGGFYFPPTVVTGLHQHDEMIQEEVFGPVITVQPYRDEAHALELANDVRFGLAASVWGRDHESIMRVTAGLDFGQVWVNCHLVQAAEMPNGGFKHSGHGNDLSALALDDYTRVKHVMTQVRTT